MRVALGDLFPASKTFSQQTPASASGRNVRERVACHVTQFTAINRRWIGSSPSSSIRSHFREVQQAHRFAEDDDDDDDSARTLRQEDVDGSRGSVSSVSVSSQLLWHNVNLTRYHKHMESVGLIRLSFTREARLFTLSPGRAQLQLFFDLASPPLIQFWLVRVLLNQLVEQYTTTSRPTFYTAGSCASCARNCYANHVC